MNSSLLYFLLALILTFVLTVLAERRLIPWLKSKKMGQPILEIGPRWHKSKEGTPTMGGLGFMAASLISMAVVAVVAALLGEPEALVPLLPTIGLGVANGLIGMIDDHAKLLKKQNQGLKAYQKFLLQLLSAALYLIVMQAMGMIDTTLVIPYLGLEWELGAFYYILALILITGVINSVNLTDGIDGLASSITVVVGAFYAVAAFFAVDSTPVAMAAALLIGGALGFLVYNFYPARVFMGDTGSLFFGGLVVGAAFLLGSPLIVLVAGLVYVVETISVMMQVSCYKLTHKRIFKMSPIHHHFEMCGWSEIKIVTVFSLAAAAFCTLAYFGL